MNIIGRAGGHRLHYGWVIASLTFTVLLASGGARSASTILLLPIEDTFGWSLATVSTGIAVNLVLFGMAGPFAPG